MSLNYLQSLKALGVVVRDYAAVYRLPNEHRQTDVSDSVFQLQILTSVSHTKSGSPMIKIQEKCCTNILKHFFYYRLIYFVL